ncbi:hypothetical protein OOU_Y34scaffold00880g1, partial [Pyricularia oryzae Y34]
ESLTGRPQVRTFNPNGHNEVVSRTIIAARGRRPKKLYESSVEMRANTSQCFFNSISGYVPRWRVKCFVAPREPFAGDVRQSAGRIADLGFNVQQEQSNNAFIIVGFIVHHAVEATNSKVHWDSAFCQSV